MGKRPATRGFQKPIDSGKRTQVRIAMVRQYEDCAECSCGAPFTQPRKGAREKAIQKHLDKKHDGQGIWL